MKQILSLSLSLLLALSLAACGGAGAGSSTAHTSGGSSGGSVSSKAGPASHPTLVLKKSGSEERREAGTVLLETEFDKPTVEDPDHEAVRKAIQADLDEIVASFQKGSDEIYDLAQSDYQSGGADSVNPHFPYFHNLKVAPAREDSAIFSLIFDEGSYQGGAHGSDYRYGRSYDAATGRVLKLSDLGNQVPATVKPIILNMVKTLHEKEQLFFDDLGEQDLQYAVADDQFYFSKDGLVFLSGEYALQSYAEGIVSFTISYDELAGKLKDEYNPGGGVTKCENATGTYTLRADGSLDFTERPEEAEAESDVSS